MDYSGKDEFEAKVLEGLPDRISIVASLEYAEYYKLKFAFQGTEETYKVSVYKDFLQNAIEPLVVLCERILEEEEKLLNVG